MMQRLVKFTVRNGREQEFLKLCKNSKTEFDAFFGCGCVESKFWQDTRVPTIFFVLSKWETEEPTSTYHRSSHLSNFWKKVIDLCVLSPEVFVLRNI